jgi:predicted RNA methylase
MQQKPFAHTATGPATGPVDAGAGNTTGGLVLKVNSAAADCVVALETSPDNTTWTEQARVTGPNWAYAASNHARRYVRSNVINLGTGGGPLSTVVTGS